MSSKQVVTSDKAPKSSLLSQAIIHNGTVYCSGNLGMDAATGKLIEGSVSDRTRQTILNMKAVLEEAGSSLNNILKANIFICSMQDYAAMNKVWEEMIPNPKPARTCVAVAQLPLGTDECVSDSIQALTVAFQNILSIQK